MKTSTFIFVALCGVCILLAYLLDTVRVAKHKELQTFNAYVQTLHSEIRRAETNNANLISIAEYWHSNYRQLEHIHTNTFYDNTNRRAATGDK